MVLPDDTRYMRAALSLAHRALGRAAPNPAVGCLIVKDGIIVGRGWTGEGGRPHAESRALEQAGKAAKDACAYITFEPCAHQGETGPCAEALIKAGIRRAVVGCIDPDSRVSGKGIKMLEAAGIEVVTGVLEDESRALNAGFISTLTEERPYVTLKIATTMDGKVATASGESQWITGDLARARVHLERSLHDAVLVGIGTALADDPMLTARLPGLKQTSVRIVLDTHLRIPLESRLVKSAGAAPLWIFYMDDLEGKQAALKKAGVRLFKAKTLKIALKTMAAEGITRLFVEGGVHVHTSFLKENLYDRFLWFRAPKLLGREGLSCMGELGIRKLEDMVSLSRKGTLMLGEDILAVYDRAA